MSLQNEKPEERVIKGVQPFLGEGGVGRTCGGQGEQSALLLSPQCGETNFSLSPEASFHFISWLDAAVIYSVSAKFGLKKYCGLWKSGRKLSGGFPN